MNKLLAIFLMLLLSQFSFAEGGKYCEPGAKLTKKLDLQEEQVEVVKQIMEEQHEKRRELRQANRDEMKQKMQGLHNETKDKLSSVLTPEQMTKFEELHAQRVEKMQKRYEKRKKEFKKSRQADDSDEDV
jgi:Spy/CpxP family protein refolding chaperone